MIYNNTSIKRVIAKVFTDFDLKEGDHRISDLLEWGGEALEKIGAFPYFTLKVSGRDGEPYIGFTNYQAKLPSNCHKVITVGFSDTLDGVVYPMRYSTGLIGVSGRSTDIPSPSNALAATDANIVSLAMSLYGLSYADALLKVNSEPATASLLASLLSTKSSTLNQNMNESGDLTYVVQDGWIKTNQASGYLVVSYQAIPTDVDGYPLIPDDPGFIEAVYWYIVMKLLYPQWRDGRVRDAVYFDAKSSWQFYCKQAYGNAMMPSLDQLKSIKNSWLRLIPDINEEDTFFDHLGQQEMTYNKNR